MENKSNINQMLSVTQIVTINGNGYLFLMPYGVPYADVYLAIQEFDQVNRANEVAAKEAEEKRKLDQEIKDGVAEAA